MQRFFWYGADVDLGERHLDGFRLFCQVACCLLLRDASEGDT